MTRPLTRNLQGLWTAVRLMLIFTVLLGIGYPLVVLAIGQLALPTQANGSLVRSQSGDIAGSSLIGQNFLDADGSPLPQYFQPRPSAAGDGYDPLASGGSNLGPESSELVATITERRNRVATFNGVPEADVPADAVTASGSGLDPEISPAYAQLQAARVAEARGVPVATIERLITQQTAGRDLGYLGDPRVNVVELNLALDAAFSN
ncbi:potassium-transporting ATPase subunit KdpC [Leucobacter sp. NPDC058333]|uniref:potassium-transporting ATPase subunit KdpC n=1 Tax=Leucobacter sp. NPDC058333 TaxID=3346450 RepID=UPI003652B790